MTVDLSDIADALRWLWVLLGLAWLGEAWLHRIASRYVLFGLVGLVLLDWSLHAIAEFAERPGSNLPSDFALYSVMMVAAALAGLGGACALAYWRGMGTLTVLAAALVCVLAGGVGGRLYQVWTHWDYYAENGETLADLSQGGFGMRGALVLGLVALVLVAWATRRSFWSLADAAALGLAVAQAIGWYGASLTHTHYGITLDAPPPQGVWAPLAQSVRGLGYNFIQDLPEAYNLMALRVPVQWMASVFFAALVVVLLVLARRGAAPGTLFLVYWLCAAAAGFFFGFLRGDETLFWNGLRADQWVDAGLVLIGLALAALHRGRVGRPVKRRVFQPA